MTDRLVRIPGPRAHLRGTLAVVRGLEDLIGTGRSHAAVLAAVDRPETLPAGAPAVETNSLKYDLYLAQGARRTAWGIAVNDRYDGDAIVYRLLGVAKSMSASYRLDLAEGICRALACPGSSRTIAFGFDDPEQHPRVKLYLQEERWGAGVTTARALDELMRTAGIDCVLPGWLPRDRAIGVVTTDVLPDARFRIKAYVGGSTATEAARGSPAAVSDLARSLDHASPLTGGWCYLTIRMEPGAPHRYSANRIYNHVQLGFSDRGALLPAAWADVRSLFRLANSEAPFDALRARLRSLPSVLVVPTASALNEDGPAAEVYFGAWDLGGDDA